MKYFKYIEIGLYTFRYIAFVKLGNSVDTLGIAGLNIL